jgi:hypothetical protein
MPGQTSPAEIFWFSPCAGDGRHLGAARLHHGNRDSLRIGKNFWAGVETFILSGYPHLEEAYRTAELLFPAIGWSSPIFQTV